MAGPPVADEVEVQLLDTDVLRFEEQGFLQLTQVTSQAEVASLRQIYDRLFKPETKIRDADRVSLAVGLDGVATLPQILNPDHYAPELLETVAYRNAEQIASRLLGDAAQYMGMHAIRKPPRVGAETPWHQDEAYWDPAYDHRALSVWMPLQPATVENGCMQFVPGTHRSAVREHRLIDPGSDGLVLADLDAVGQPVVCELPAGGATVHDGRTLHYTGPNRSDQPRRALVVAFRIPPRLREVPRVFGWQRPEWYAEL